MLRIIWILIIVLLLPTAGTASQIQPLKEKELIHALANLEILAEAKWPESKGMAVRILRVRDHGECDGSPQTCPKSTLYIAVSEYGEYPEQKVYRLPKRHDWKFSAWRHLPQHDGPEDFVILELTAEEPSPTPSKGWWIERRYRVRLNYRGAELQEL